MLRMRVIALCAHNVYSANNDDPHTLSDNLHREITSILFKFMKPLRFSNINELYVPRIKTKRVLSFAGSTLWNLLRRGI